MFRRIYDDLRRHLGALAGSVGGTLIGGFIGIAIGYPILMIMGFGLGAIAGVRFDEWLERKRR